MTLVHGGRVTNVLAPPPPPPPEGIILPPSKPVNDTSGRIFLFFVDDLHMDFRNTGRIRELFKKIKNTLVHDGDMFGIVSSGPSSIAIDMTYDRTRLDEAIKKIAGNGLKPTDIINGPSGSDGPSEVRYRAHVAFSTATDFLNELEKVHNRRKAVVWVSDGYDFNPFQDARLGLMDPNSPFAQNEMARSDNQANQQAGNDGHRSDHAAAAAERGIRRRRPRARGVRPDARRQPRERDHLHDRSARAGRRLGHRRERRPDAVERLHPQVAGQPARPRGPDRRHRGRQPERLRQGAEADRRRDERLLRARLLLEESGSAEEAPAGGREGHAPGHDGVRRARNTASSPCRLPLRRSSRSAPRAPPCAPSTAPVRRSRGARGAPPARDRSRRCPRRRSPRPAACTRPPCCPAP